jgi:hypothetical protein
MAVSSVGLRPKSDCSGKSQKQLYSKLQTRPLVREGATILQSLNCLKEISRRKKNWPQVPDGRMTTGQTGRLTVGRKLTATALDKAKPGTEHIRGLNLAAVMCMTVQVTRLSLLCTLLVTRV